MPYQQELTLFRSTLIISPSRSLSSVQTLLPPEHGMVRLSHALKYLLPSCFLVLPTQIFSEPFPNHPDTQQSFPQLTSQNLTLPCFLLSLG